MWYDITLLHTPRTLQLILIWSKLIRRIDTGKLGCKLHFVENVHDHMALT